MAPIVGAPMLSAGVPKPLRLKLEAREAEGFPMRRDYEVVIDGKRSRQRHTRSVAERLARFWQRSRCRVKIIDHGNDGQEVKRPLMRSREYVDF